MTTEENNVLLLCFALLSAILITETMSRFLTWAQGNISEEIRKLNRDNNPNREHLWKRVSIWKLLGWLGTIIISGLFVAIYLAWLYIVLFKQVVRSM